nr:uncharacterized protein LOC127307830 [Lolium perenne]
MAEVLPWRRQSCFRGCGRSRRQRPMLSFGVIHSLAGGYVKVEQFEWSSKCIALVFAQSLLFPKMQMLSFGVNHSLAGGFVKVEQFEWSSGCISLLYSWSGLTCRSCSSTVQ